MTRIKSVLMLLIGAVLAVFVYENWVAAPHIKLFGKELIQLNISVIMIIFFSLGFSCGLLACFGWHRTQKKKALDSIEEKAQEPQGSTQQEAKQE